MYCTIVVSSPTALISVPLCILALFIRPYNTRIWRIIRIKSPDLLYIQGTSYSYRREVRQRTDVGTSQPLDGGRANDNIRDQPPTNAHQPARAQLAS